MPLITAIKSQKQKNRFNIYIDGKFAFALTADALVKAGLTVNKEITSDDIKNYTIGNEFQKTFDRILNFLSYRPRSQKELTQWFQRKKVEKEIQQRVLIKIKDLNLVNDEEFAKWWTEQRKVFRPTGFRLLALELRRKGISNEIINKLKNDQAVGDDNKTSEKDLAKSIVVKKLNSMKNLSLEVMKKKLYGILARRGFNWDIVKEVVDEILKTG